MVDHRLVQQVFADLSKPDRTILRVLIEANGLKPVARALLEIAHERTDGFPPMTGSGHDDLAAISQWSERRATFLGLRPGDEGYVWPFRPGYVGNAAGDICALGGPGAIADRLLTAGTVWVPLDAVIEAEAYGWSVIWATKGAELVQIRR